ncbi:MAG: RnfABCDGE type electron transport complex subunit D [Ruminococcaceae bacterium]|nr:RnfABCDGE type electron transport complex subunit D [Oscillospiraceae bacterium]
MTKLLSVAPAPHIRSKKTTNLIMLDVIIALLPVVVASGILFGLNALVLIAVSVAGCVLSEYLWCRLMKKPQCVQDLSAVVTGILIALNVPASLPIWQVLFGDVVAIIIVKQLFGGIGYNFVNPALAARVVMGLSFPASMTSYTYPAGTLEGMSGATPLSSIDALSNATPEAATHLGKYADLFSLFIGRHGGVLGETCALAILIGGIYLIIRGIIKPIIPLSFLATTFLLHYAFGSIAPLHAILSGGILLGAVFMATDYTTSPYTDKGKLVFGVGCGILTAVIRTYTNTHEGVTYSILIMNLLVPYINKLTRKKPYGGAAK